jgi:hypothetical protein
MKKTGLIIKTILLIAAIFMILGCGLGPKRSKDECLQEFFNNIQSSRWTSMYNQIHPDNPNYNTYKNGTTFNTLFGGNPTYSISARNGDTYTVNVSDDPGGHAYTFEREDDDMFSDGYWSIRSFHSNGGTY